jgi:hypothetical protein
LYAVSILQRKYKRSGYDLRDLEVSYDSGLPRSYGGMSGGGLWRVYLEKVGKDVIVKERMLYGVAFYQRFLRGKKGLVVCHGPQSVYGMLVDAIRKKWNDRPDG